MNADISKTISSTTHKFQNKKNKDIIFVCFKFYIDMFYRFGDATRQIPCGSAPNSATFADVST